MNTAVQSLSKVSPIRWFVVLTVIACALALGLPVDPQTLAQLHTNVASYRLAILALLVPYIVIWFLSFFAWEKLRLYVTFISKSREEPAFRSLNLAMGLLAFGVVVPTIITLVLHNIAISHQGLRPVAALTGTYLTIIVAISVFTIMGSGAHGLTVLSKVRPSLNGIRLFALLFIIMGSFFTYMMVHNNYTSHHPLYLGNVPLILTVVVPYLFAWFVGILASYELKLYATRVKGLLYQRALTQFASGLVVVVGGSIFSQFVSAALANNHNLSLAFVLVLDYIVLIIIAIGLVLMALGTRKLRKIEEV